jgi:hypothetical protein
MSKVKTVATIAFMLGASVGHAQPPFSQSSNPGSYVGFAQTPGAAIAQTGQGFNGRPLEIPLSSGGGMYVACWAEVPSHNAAYFSATFAAPAVNALRKQFRSFVTTQYGPVSKLQCTGKFSEAVVNEQVGKWKDSARAEKNAIIDLSGGDKAATAPQPQSRQSVRYEQSRSGQVLDGIPGGYVPGNNSSNTVAGQSNFQR